MTCSTERRSAVLPLDRWLLLLDVVVEALLPLDGLGTAVLEMSRSSSSLSSAVVEPESRPTAVKTRTKDELQSPVFFFLHLCVS